MAPPSIDSLLVYRQGSGFRILDSGLFALGTPVSGIRLRRRCEPQRQGVDSVALAGRVGTVVEDVAEVRVAARAEGLVGAAVIARLHGPGPGVPEGRPAAGVVLRLRIEEDLAAA